MKISDGSISKSGIRSDFATRWIERSLLSNLSRCLGCRRGGKLKNTSSSYTRDRASHLAKKLRTQKARSVLHLELISFDSVSEVASFHLSHLLFLQVILVFLGFVLPPKRIVKSSGRRLEGKKVQTDFRFSLFEFHCASRLRSIKWWSSFWFRFGLIRFA